MKLADLEREVFFKRRELAKAKREYRNGYRAGQRMLRAGRDYGRGSELWYSKTDFWKEGYEAGWKAALEEDRA